MLPAGIAYGPGGVIGSRRKLEIALIAGIINPARRGPFTTTLTKENVMKLIIGKPEKHEPEEPPLYLWLELDDESVVVKGQRGDKRVGGNSLAVFWPNGSGRMIGGVSPDLGLKLDDDGRLRE